MGKLKNCLGFDRIWIMYLQVACKKKKEWVMNMKFCLYLNGNGFILRTIVLEI